MENKFTADYLNTTVWCKVAPSGISGVGLVALRDIKKGQELTDYTLDHALNGKTPVYYLFTEEEFNQIQNEVKELILERYLWTQEFDRLLFISPNQDQILGTFMNHSKTPNTDGVLPLRDILKGEELTKDYTKQTDTMHSLTKEKMKDIL